MLPVWKLIGFVLYVILYFTVLETYTVWPAESLKSVFFKVMPIMHLVFVAISISMDEDIKAKSSPYRWNITFGLMASGIGDCCLVFADWIYPGIAMFSIAHIFYIRAFGIRPVGSGPMAASFAVMMVASYFFFVDVLPVTLKFASVIYLILIFTMAWRSMVLLHYEKSFDSCLACLGAFLFIASDSMFVIDKFHSSFIRAPLWVMLTYYGAQLGIALSAYNSHSPSVIQKNT